MLDSLIQYSLIRQCTGIARGRDEQLNRWPSAFQGEMAVRTSPLTVRLIRPDDRIQIGVQDRPHVSTAVVSTA